MRVDSSHVTSGAVKLSKLKYYSYIYLWVVRLTCVSRQQIVSIGLCEYAVTKTLWSVELAKVCHHQACHEAKPAGPVIKQTLYWCRSLSGAGPAVQGPRVWQGLVDGQLCRQVGQEIKVWQQDWRRFPCRPYHSNDTETLLFSFWPCNFKTSWRQETCHHNVSLCACQELDIFQYTVPGWRCSIAWVVSGSDVAHSSVGKLKLLCLYFKNWNFLATGNFLSHVCESHTCILCNNPFLYCTLLQHNTAFWAWMIVPTQMSHKHTTNQNGEQELLQMSSRRQATTHIYTTYISSNT